MATRRVRFRWCRNPFATNRHLARFIILGLYTGTRKQAIFGVQWMANTNGGWVNMERGVMHRRGEGVAETNKRQPPVRLGSRILGHLGRWKRLDDSDRDTMTEENDGKPVAAYLHVVSWMGRGVSSVRTAWDTAVEYAWLDPKVSGTAQVTPHVLRHTRATWLMQNGIDLWEAAGSLGMSVKTLEKVYGHHDPDFQINAARV